LADFINNNSSLVQNYGKWYYIDGQGNYHQANASNAVDYTTNGFETFLLDEPEIEFFSASQPLLATLGVHFTVQFDGLPEAKISVTVTTTKHEKGNADLTISYDTRKLQFVAANDKDAPNEEAGSLTITNQDNVKLLLHPKGINGIDSDEADVTIDGKIIATIKDVNGFTRIEYIDGTFESL
jgi:hypothetical protein